MTDNALTNKAFEISCATDAAHQDAGPEAWPGVQVGPLVQRLRQLSQLRRGAFCPQLAPAEIGASIDAAADLLEKMSQAMVGALENNLHLADGDNCTLIDLVRVARGPVAADSLRGPVTERAISVRLRCRVQRNGDGTVTVTVPRLSSQAWTGPSEGVAVKLARGALDEFSS